jgi:hypothetical protein
LTFTVVGYFAVNAYAADPQKGANTPGEIKKANASGRKLVPMSELLKGASPAAKEEFWGSLVMVDGKAASVTVDLLTKELGKEKVGEILAVLFPGGGKRPTVSGVHATGLCGDKYCYNSVCTGSYDHRYCVDSQSNSVCNC